MILPALGMGRISLNRTIVDGSEENSRQQEEGTWAVGLGRRGSNTHR